MKDTTTGRFMSYIQNINCENCSVEFKPRILNTKYCSKKCYWEYKKGKKQPEAQVLKRAAANTGRQTGEHRNCFICKKEFYVMPSKMKDNKGKFCSNDCFHEWTRTSGNPEWKGDAYPENKRLRQSYEYKQWRKEVFLRDNFTCQICGFKSCGVKPPDINADHIKAWSLFPEERFNVDNGRTLCLPCHYKTDSYGKNIKLN